MPDWEGIRPVEVGGITDGAVTEFRMSIGIVPQRWVAKHHSHIEGEQFCDDSIKGPFARWNHVHKFVDGGEHEMTIEDKIDWKPVSFFENWCSNHGHASSTDNVQTSNTKNSC